MSWFVHVIVSPTWIDDEAGPNLKSLIVTPVDAAAAVTVVPVAALTTTLSVRPFARDSVGTKAGAALMRVVVIGSSGGWAPVAGWGAAAGGGPAGGGGAAGGRGGGPAG